MDPVTMAGESESARFLDAFATEAFAENFAPVTPATPAPAASAATAPKNNPNTNSHTTTTLPPVAASAAPGPVAGNSTADPGSAVEEPAKARAPRDAARAAARYALAGMVGGALIGVFLFGPNSAAEPANVQALVRTGADDASSSDTPPGGSAASFAEPAPEAGLVDAKALLNTALLDAVAFQKRYGSFTGWRPQPPVLGAAGGSVAVVTVIVEGSCYSNGIAPGYDGITRNDVTGVRCLTTSLDALQAKLDTLR